MDNGHYFRVQRHNILKYCQPHFTNTGYLCTIYFTSHSHVLVVDIAHYSNIDRFLWVNTVAKYCGMFDSDKKILSFSTFDSCTVTIRLSFLPSVLGLAGLA